MQHGYTGVPILGLAQQTNRQDSVTYIVKKPRCICICACVCLSLSLSLSIYLSVYVYIFLHMSLHACCQASGIGQDEK